MSGAQEKLLTETMATTLIHVTSVTIYSQLLEESSVIYRIFAYQIYCEFTINSIISLFFNI